MGIRLQRPLRPKEQRDVHQFLAPLRAKRYRIHKRLFNFKYRQLPLLNDHMLFFINELLERTRSRSPQSAYFDSVPRVGFQLKCLTGLVAMEGDSRQLKRVLFNLLSNAFKLVAFSGEEQEQTFLPLRSKEKQEEENINAPLVLVR